MAEEDRLSDLPDSILIHILSMLCEYTEYSKKVVRTSVLSKRWKFLWKSVPVSLDFNFVDYSIHPEKDIQEFINSTHRELHYWRSFEKIRKLKLMIIYPRVEKIVKDVDSWIHFAIKLENVEDLELKCGTGYEFPQFAYKNTSLRNLDLRSCKVTPLANVNWSGIVSLSFSYMYLTDDVMKKVLSGCPNLECLKFEKIKGFHRLKISNVKTRKLVIKSLGDDREWLELIAPYIQDLKILGSCHGICLKKVDSLVTAVLDFHLDFSSKDPWQRKRKESTCLKELFHSVAHVEKLELGPWCIEKYLSTLFWEGWQPPLSKWKFLQLSTTSRQLDFPGICSLLQSSSDLETLVIDGSKKLRAQLLSYANKDEQIKKSETHNFSSSFPHLKTVEILNFSVSMLPLVKYLLKHGIVLQKFVMVARSKMSDVSPDYDKMVLELLSFPRSSPLASVIFETYLTSVTLSL